ncbi:MAG: hypothetical protein ABII13_02360 [Patescibacteria group bacterium]|nr:hypothetical protein [Patescibacteria group bacterium]MBU2508825.1 hypothetical protein [Patescibacteria group bacterium]
MHDRLKQLLRIVVEEVVQTGEPVGSQYLVEKFDLGVSPATIRNWLAFLDDQGYLTQPHTSSGRVPTEKGYRFYLKELMEERAPKHGEFKKFEEAHMSSDQSTTQMRQLAKLVADMTEHAVVVAKHSDIFSAGLTHLLSQPEFANHERLVGLGQVFDRMDEIVESMLFQDFAEPTALIGGDCPFGEDCGSIVLKLSDGTLIGVLGPIRMDYPRGFALLRAAKELFN